MAQLDVIRHGVTKPESAELLFQAISSIKDYAIFLLDPLGRVLTWNAGAEIIEGYKANEIVGKHFSIFYTTEDLKRGHPDEELVIARESGMYHEEGWRIRKNGTRFWASVVITRLLGKDGELVGFSKVTKDLTDKKIAEEALRESEERFRLMIDTVKDYAIFMLDPNGYITTWNSGASRIKGYEATEVIGKHFSIFYPENTDPNLINKDLEIATRDGHLQTEGFRRRKDGSLFWANVIITPIYNKDGRCTGFAKVTRDVTELRETQIRLQRLNQELEKRVESRTLQLQRNEAELKRAKDAAEAANLAKSSFLANMSHEIRTPLGAVIGFSELLCEANLTKEEREHYIETVKRNGDLLSNIIRDILDLSKVEVGKLETEIVEVPLKEVLIDLTSLLHLQASDKGIQLLVSQDEHLPEKIYTDPLRLRQILINIVGNAIKFTQKGEVKVHLRMTNMNHRGRGLLEFLVQDTGKGIDANSLENLFQPFSQADISSRRVYGGTGLGLVLSKRIAKLLGGDVNLIESNPGKGSTFSITINPGRIDSSHELSNLADPAKSKDNSGSVTAEAEVKKRLSGVRILVVEDAPDNQLLVSRILKIAGADVDLAENGQVGVTKAKQGNYDLVLMDLQMPVMDGYQATALLRSLGFTQPILALTAHALKEERQRCLNGGFNEHLSKPIDRALLIDTIAHFVGR